MTLTSKLRGSGPLRPELPEVVTDRGGANTGDGTDSGEVEGVDDRGGTTTGNGAGDGKEDDSDDSESAGTAGSARGGCTGGAGGIMEGNLSLKETPGARARSWFSTPRTRSGATGTHSEVMKGTRGLRAVSISARMSSLASTTTPAGPAKPLRSL
jgi:hypothetical protein